MVMQGLSWQSGNSLLVPKVAFTTTKHQAFRCCRASSRRHRYVPTASEEGERSKGGLDWDNAWSSFKEGLNKNIPAVEDRSATRPQQPQQQRPSNKSPQFARDSRKQLRENIKKQENLVLDFWSQELFFKIGGLFIAVLLVVFLLTGGPGGPE